MVVPALLSPARQQSRRWASLSGRRVLLTLGLTLVALGPPRAFFFGGDDKEQAKPPTPEQGQGQQQPQPQPQPQEAQPQPQPQGPQGPPAQGAEDPDEYEYKGLQGGGYDDDTIDTEWKQDAWDRQNDFLQQRLRRFGADKKVSAERILWQKKRQATWRAMSERGSEKEFLGDDNSAIKGLIEQEDGLTIDVTLSKPLGLHLSEINPANPLGALIQDISKDYSAEKDGSLEIGDVLIAVNGKLVWGKSFEECIAPIAASEKEVTLKFFRYDM